MSAVMEQYPRRATRQDVEPPRQGALDMARRCRYLALLRRWAQERLPAGTRAALDAADWARGVLIHAAMSDVGPDGAGSLLLRLRSRLIADGVHAMPAANDARPSPRVEQLIGGHLVRFGTGQFDAQPRQQFRVGVGTPFAFERVVVENDQVDGLPRGAQFDTHVVGDQPALGPAEHGVGALRLHDP